MRVVTARIASASVLFAASLPSASRNAAGAHSHAIPPRPAVEPRPFASVGHFADEADLLSLQSRASEVVEIEQGDKSTLLGHRHIHQRLRANGFQADALPAVRASVPASAHTTVSPRFRSSM